MFTTTSWISEPNYFIVHWCKIVFVFQNGVVMHTCTAGFFLYFRQYLYWFQNIMGIILDLFIVVLTDRLRMTTSLMVGFLKLTTVWKPHSQYYNKIWRNCSRFYLIITVNPLLSPPGGLFFSSTFEGGLI